MCTDNVVETGKENLREGFDPPARKVFFLPVVSHEADLAQALVCGTDRVDVARLNRVHWIRPGAILVKSRLTSSLLGQPHSLSYVIFLLVSNMSTKCFLATWAVTCCTIMSPSMDLCRHLRDLPSTDMLSTHAHCTVSAFCQPIVERH